MKQSINEIKRMQQLAAIKLTEDLDANYVPSYEHILPYKDKINQVVLELENINSEIENSGPLSEDIVDAIEILQSLIGKL
jgi:hypothetical protein